MEKGTENFSQARGRARCVWGLFGLALVSGCSSFGPDPYSEPLYVLDEYGMVYGELPSESGRSAVLVPRFGTFQRNPADPFYDPYYAWPGAFGIYSEGLRNPWLRLSPYYSGAYRPPISHAPSPLEPVAPVVGRPPGERPLASPLMKPPHTRTRPEPADIGRDGPRAQAAGTARSPGRVGRNPTQSRPTPARAPRARTPRAEPPRPPSPSRPRVIDP